VADIITGGGNAKGATDVGDIYAMHSGNTLTVMFETEDGWAVDGAHIAVAKCVNRIPQSNGNPVPGQFQYHFTFSPTTSGELSMALTIPVGDVHYLAVHLNVRHAIGYNPPDINAFDAALPEQVSVMVGYPGSQSYFEDHISGGTILDGMYIGGCLDIGHFISPSVIYTANVYSSYEGLPPTVTIDHPENLDLINWIVNQNFIGKTASDGNPFTWGDVQEAMWALVDNEYYLEAGKIGTAAHVVEIVALACANGEDFVPGCGGSVVVILQPIEGTVGGTSQAIFAQVIYAQLGIYCTPIYGCGETGWGIVGGIFGDCHGDGLGPQNDFCGKNWAEYIPITLV